VANLGLEDDQILLVRIASGYSDVHQVTTLALSIGDEALVDEVPELEFNDIIPGLTVVLRSSDDVDFFVFKTILSKVSVVFRDMFDLPNAAPELSSPLETDNQRHGLSVIQVTETSSTLNIILRLCYPVENPDLSILENIRLFLEARRKYMIEAFDRTIKDALA